MPDLADFMRKRGQRRGRVGRKEVVEREEQGLPPIAVPERDWGWDTDLPVALLRNRAEAWYGERTQQRTVLCDGDPKPWVLCIGEAPAREECKQGLPFVGPSGGLLRKMLRAHGLDVRAGGGVLATNAALWFCAPGSNPGAGALRAARPWLRALIQSARPKVLLALGATAATALLGSEGSVTRWRGGWHRVDPGLVDCLGAAQHPEVRVTWHPAYVLRNERKTKPAEVDVEAVGLRVKERGRIPEVRRTQGWPSGTVRL